MPPLTVAVAGLEHDHIWNELPHWASLAASGRVVVTACSSPFLNLLARASKEYAIPRSYASFEDMLREEPVVDLLQICTDNASHLPVVRAACARAEPPKVVVMEKPLASSFADAKEIRRLCEEKSVLMLVNWPNWKAPAWRALMSLVRRGDIGEVRHAHFRGGHAGPQAFGCSPEFVGWLYDERRNGAGAFMDYCCYSASLFSFLLPNPPLRITGTRLLAYPPQNPGAADDTAAILLEYPGSTAVGEGSWVQLTPAIGANPAVYGSEGGVAIVDGEVVLWGQSGVSETDKAKYGREKEVQRKVEVPELRAPTRSAPELAVWAAEQGVGSEEVGKVVAEELVNVDVALRAQAVLEAGLRSAKEGRKVAWEEIWNQDEARL